MRIDPTGTHHGIPSVKLRDALRRAVPFVRPDFLRVRLGLTAECATSLMADLLAAGWIEPDEFSPEAFVLAPSGARFCNAAAGPMVSRATAEKAVTALLTRVEVVQQSSDFLYSVVHIKVFGSYITDAPKVSDVDLCLEIAAKQAHEEQWRLTEAQFRQAEADGRKFRDIVHRASWPRERVVQFLRGRSRVLSLQDGDDPVLEQTTWRFLYLAPTLA